MGICSFSGANRSQLSTVLDLYPIVTSGKAGNLPIYGQTLAKHFGYFKLVSKAAKMG